MRCKNRYFILGAHLFFFSFFFGGGFSFSLFFNRLIAPSPPVQGVSLPSVIEKLANGVGQNKAGQPAI